MIIFCREHGWAYNAIMCPKCSKVDFYIDWSDWPEPAEDKPTELLSVPCNTTKFRTKTLLEFL